MLTHEQVRFLKPAFPLPLHSYYATIGQEKDSWSRQTDKIEYHLSEAAKRTVYGAASSSNGGEGNQWNYKLEYRNDPIHGQNVFFTTDQHDFARGAVTLLLGWSNILTSPMGQAVDIYNGLVSSGLGKFLLTRSDYGLAMFNLESEEDLHWVQLRFSDIGVAKSRLEERA